VYADIRGVPLGEGRQMTAWWVVDDGNFWRFRWLLLRFGNFRGKASNITCMWRYMLHLVSL